MADFSHHIIPVPQPEVEDVFEVYQVTYTFYREVEHRQAFDEYCQWYDQVAEQHRQELAQMRREINFMSWFYRKSMS